MAEQNPSLHIDSDWKKQAQEEKRRLAEVEKQKAAASAGAPAEGAGAPSASSSTGVSPGASSAAARAGRPGALQGQREMPPASFATLVQTMVTQALFYLGDLAPRGGEPVLNLDAAKHQIDMLAVLEEKTANNLIPEEKRLLDAALYESRMRYIAVSSQFLGP